MQYIFLVSLMFAGVVHRVASTSLPLIGSDGVCKPQSQVASFLSGSKIASSSGCQTLGIIDLSSSGCRLVNSILKTSFPDSYLGICLDATESGAVLLAQYDCMYSSTYCGSKAADFLGSIANTLMVVLPPGEASEIMSAHDQTLRRLANAIKNRVHTAMPVKALYFLTADSESRAAEDVNQAFESVWSDVCEEEKLGVCVDVKAFAVDVNDVDRLSAFKASLSKALESTPSEDTLVGSLAGKLSETWAPIASSTPRPIFTLVQRQSIFLIESAFTAGVAHSETTFSQWQVRIGKGKVVGKFGSRVQELLDSVHERFMEQTKGTVSVRERSQRARQLRDNIESVAATLFKQQLAILQTQATNRFRRMMIKLSVSNERASTDSGKEDEQQALRKALFDFRALALDLEVESLGLSSTSFQADVSSALQTLLTEFPESSFGRLEAIKKLERETKRPKRRGGGGRAAKGQGRAIKIGVNLVGMLRPPGTGNLQGFAGYSTALLGLPLELLLGVQNDGDSPEIMGEDREYPLLRLQPKLNFDIDL